MSRTTFELGKGATLDLQRLVDTRMLVQANSGGGKSWALRRLLEQTNGAIQHLVIDPEGEFSTLRERFDYVLAAKSGGDTTADPRAARLLAERLLELKVSAILDIYELKAHDRVRFVRYFLEALVDAPKKLWHPTLVVLDEAHVYCPQAGEAESAGAVIDLATRGRKRGFCAVFATQRLSKLHKDAAAECNNKLIGRTGLDVDIKRAADELGLGRERFADLRQLEAGEFFVFGPAISREVVSVRIGGVLTTHPRAGARLEHAPPPSAAVKALLPKLADLPAEAEERQRTTEGLRAENAALKRQLAQRPDAKPAPPVAPKEVEVVKPATVAKLEALVERGLALGDKIKNAAAALAASMPRALPKTVMPSTPARHERTTARPARVVDVRAIGENGAGEVKVLTAVAQHAQGITREQASILTGYKTSTRNAYLQRLGGRALVEFKGERIFATADGIAMLGSDFEPLPTGDALREHWLRMLPEGERKVLEVAVGYRDGVTREAISQATGYKPSTRNAYLQRLGARQLVCSSGNIIEPAPELFG